MKQIFEIKDIKIIDKMLQRAEYGTLALCQDNKPYAVPLNFVKVGDAIYFHGAQKGKKIKILKENSYASFSVVENFSLIPSYFSTDDGLACPATQFFKSIIIDGRVEFVKEHTEKAEALEALMQKLQSEGNYKPLSDDVYKKVLSITAVYKLIPQAIGAKFKFGQHVNAERFAKILHNLEMRATELDLETLKMMRELRVDGTATRT